MERWKEFNYIFCEDKSLETQAMEILREKMHECDNISNKHIRWTEMLEDIKQWLSEEWNSI